MSIDYLSQNLFNTCGTGYNLGCGGSYSAGNLLGGIGNSIWSLCSTYGSTCNTKAGAIAQKRAIKQMWGQVGFALGERAVNWILNLGAGFIQSAIVNAGNESPTAEADLKTQKAELDKQIKEKLTSIEATENDYQGKNAEELNEYKKLQININSYNDRISTLDTAIKNKEKDKQPIPDNAPAEEKLRIENANKEIDTQIKQMQAEIDFIKKEIPKVEAQCEEISKNLEKTKTDIGKLIKNRETIQKELAELENSETESEKEKDAQDRKELKKLLKDINKSNDSTEKSQKIQEFIDKYKGASEKVQAKYQKVYDKLMSDLKNANATYIIPDDVNADNNYS